MTMSKEPYHSSLTEPIEAPPRHRFSIGNSTAFVADLGRGLPAQYERCDLMYSEIAWPAGYAQFIDRSGGGASDYEGYISTIAATIDRADSPWVIVCGKRQVRSLPTPRAVTSVNLNTGGRWIASAVALTYGIDLPDVRRREGWTDIDTDGLLREFARRFRCVGDPSCGYGNTGRIFYALGKDFVLSDISSSCIGYIAAHAAEWRTS